MKNHLKLFVSSLFLFLLSVTIHGQNMESAFDNLLNELFPSDGPGGAALVARNGEVLYLKAFGKANLELDVDMKPEHIFRIGSITKQFTACAILKLAEEGKLSLQDDITTFIEDYPTHGHTITVEHLLAHTSGIRSYTGLDKWTSETRKQDFTPEEMVDYFKNEPMDFAPGEEFRYNNSAYFLLGYIIEKVSGKTYEEYIEETFFEPLGMEHSFYGNTSRIIKGRAGGYQQEEGNFQNADFLSMTQPYAAGSLLSNVEDLYTWYQAVMAGKVVSRESLEKAHTSSRLNNGKLTGYGYGWFLGNIQGSPMVEHGGGINGYLTASLFLPEEKLFVAVFSNCNCHPPGATAFKMAAIAIGKPYEWEKIEMSAQELATYEAVYESEFDGERTVLLENGKLFSMRSGGSKQQILPYAKDKFFFEDGMTTLDFQRGPNGNIVSVISKGTGMSISWVKTDKEVTRMAAVELPAEMLDKYVGEYQLAPEFILSVFREGGQMYAKATGQDKIEIFPFEEHKFFAKVIDAKLVFNLDETGKVASLTLLQNGEHQAEKIN